RLGQVRPRGDIAAGVDQVGPYVGVTGIELAGDPGEEGAVAGGGQGDDAGAGVGQRGTDRGAVVRGVVDGADRADHSGGLTPVASFHDGVQPVLGRQYVFDVAGAQADAGDSPLFGNARAGEVIEVDGLMRTVKVARTDVDDTALQG